VKAIAKRLRRLEDEFGPADGKPRDRFRFSSMMTVGGRSCPCILAK
jgi:hypothetical protein